MLEHVDRSAPRRPATARRPVLLVVLFVISLVLLIWIVLWKLEVPYIGAAAGLPRPVKLVPFVATAQAGPSAPLEVAANVALFVPFGLYLGLLAPTWRWWHATALLAGSSLALETAQHVLSVGSFDTTDVITNTAGGLIGLGAAALARRRWGSRTTPILMRSLTVATALAVLAIGILIASPLHVSQSHDVVVRISSAALNIG
jgi:glycopeptide antibiotics resistance protein